MKQYIRKADIILLIALVITGLAASAVLTLSRTAAGADAKVIIESGGDLYATYSLFEDGLLSCLHRKHTGQTVLLRTHLPRQDHSMTITMSSRSETEKSLSLRVPAKIRSV